MAIATTPCEVSDRVTAKARVNGVALHADGELLDAETLRQRACTELLRQAAQAAGLLDPDDQATPDGVLSEAAANAIEALLEGTLKVPDDPSEDECHRHYEAHESAYRTGERVHLRHILFAVTPGVHVPALRQRAEAALLDVRNHDDPEFDRFTEAARTLSNCPSAADGGDLGWLTAADCAPEVAREVFGHAEVGVLPRLVRSRFGLHVIEVVERMPGVTQPFATVRATVAQSLRQHSYVTALRQYLNGLAGAAVLAGVDLK
ncbi:MAG: peptidylprolyl isomerase [Candidatus Accumulibacter phosphatis]|nr:peptidylprolyl isomerase [Candidatus Accumulibacter phosphatis]